jgi:hypothetical protein
MFDDIFLTHSRYHTQTGMMYALSREGSNRRQQNYRVSSQTPVEMDCESVFKGLARSCSVSSYDDEIVDEADSAIDIHPPVDIDDISLYVPTESSVDICSTQTMRRLIREVSS